MAHKAIINIRTKDALYIVTKFTKQGAKRTLFQQACYTLTRLYSFCRYDYVYAYQYLLDSKRDILTFKQDVIEQIERLEKHIQLRAEGIHVLPSPVLADIPLSIGDPVLFELCDSVRLFDDLCGTIYRASNVGVFTQQNAQLALKSNYKKRLFKLLSVISQKGTRTFPQVNIQDYLAQSPIYLKHALQLGKITPQALNSALHSTLSPSVPAHRLNTIAHQLKHM